MSKLYFSEEGRVIPGLCEELTTYRRARKVLRLRATSEQGELYVLARPYPENRLPLRMAVNGREVPAVQPASSGYYNWYEIQIDESLLKPGENTYEFWTDSTAMNAWSLAIEAGHAESKSYISDDAGKTWRNERMAYLNAVRGEYVARMRLAEGEDPPPPIVVWEDLSSPRLASLRKLVPPAARDRGPLMKRVRAISAWLASSWEHTASDRAAQYGPWDAETILAWGRTQSGHNGKPPILMCVHYAVAFVSCCQAVGISARCAVLTEAINGWNGHFVAEVWFAELRKWVVVDPNTDAIFFKDGAPLSMTEIQEAGHDLSGLIEWGPGNAFQRRFPHIVKFIRDNLEKGLCFKLRSVWHRADFLSHPELSPPGHGSLAYCETGLVWEKRYLERGLGMFRYFGDPDYFNAPPTGFD